MFGGKGGGTQFFNYEILFADSTKIYIKKDVKFDKSYNGNYISLIGTASKSPIHHDSLSYQNTSPFWQIQSIINVRLNKKTLPNN
jgi:hypothetical protein